MLGSILKRGSAPEDNSGNFDWPVALEAERFLRSQLDSFLQKNRFARRLSERMRDETDTDLFEWVDHLTITQEHETTLRELDFVSDRAVTLGGENVLTHPRAALPRVIVQKAQDVPAVVAIHPESVADFVAAHSLRAEIEGPPFSRFRRVIVSLENAAQLEAVERNAYRGFVPAPLGSTELQNIVRSQELWQTRRRFCASDREGCDVAFAVMSQIFELVGRDLACHLFFQNERRYWTTRNRAARIVKNRLDRLGLGWGNHDRHVYRSSREHFGDLLHFFQTLGFQKREHFNGLEAGGWGAQVLEQSQTGITVLCDVDLNPDEAQTDFAKTHLPPRSTLGTIGLWVGLHGESLLEAGMHHLEARFNFDAVRALLHSRGVESMNPSSETDYLRRTLTVAETWPVRRERAQKLLQAGTITQAQFDRFTTQGATGSSLEYLERHGGFKGFDQSSIGIILAATDPRNG